MLLLLFCLKLLHVTTAMRACQACPSPASALVRLLFRAFTISAPLPMTRDTELLVSSQFSGLISLFLLKSSSPVTADSVFSSLVSSRYLISFSLTVQMHPKSAQGPQDWADLLSPRELHFMQYFCWS